LGGKQKNGAALGAWVRSMLGGCAARKNAKRENRGRKSDMKTHKAKPKH